MKRKFYLVLITACLFGCATGINPADEYQIVGRPDDITSKPAAITQEKYPPLRGEPIPPLIEATPTPSPEPVPLKQELQEVPPHLEERLGKLEKESKKIRGQFDQLRVAVHDMALRTRQYEGELIPKYAGPFREGSVNPKLLAKRFKEIKAEIEAEGLTPVLIEGFTDRKGLEQRNKKISQERADNTKAYLQEIGLNVANTTTKGSGEIAELGICEDNRAVIIWCLPQKTICTGK